jgi:hypothetical protein
MIKPVLQPLGGLAQTRRIGPSTWRTERIHSLEIGILLCAGALAAVAVVAFSPALRIPGHAILRAALPMVCGMALIPRRLAGSIMALGAGATVLVFSAAGPGGWQPAAVVSLLALGPAIDIAMTGRSVPGWRLYLRFAAAGVLANTLAYFLRGGISLFGLDGQRPHMLARFDLGVFASFAVCGAIAGLLSALVCFQFSARQKGPEAREQ